MKLTCCARVHKIIKLYKIIKQRWNRNIVIVVHVNKINNKIIVFLLQLLEVEVKKSRPPFL